MNKSQKLLSDIVVYTKYAKYNSQLKVKYLIVTNGMKHYCCKMDYETSEIEFLEEIPEP